MKIMVVKSFYNSIGLQSCLNNEQLEHKRRIKMLIIKDNVDLSELEKFGFVKDGEAYVFESKIYNVDGGINGSFTIFVNKYKAIFIKAEDKVENGWVDNIGKLFDLIEAGLVERV